MSTNSLQVLKGDEVPINGLNAKSITIIGYGNQGAAHAANLRDSGCDVSICTRNDKCAIDNGFPIISAEQAGKSDLIIMAMPDEAQALFFNQSLKTHLKDGATLGFIHGFAIHHKQIEALPGIGIVMVAPKGPGKTLREKFLDNSGIPALVSVHCDNSHGTAQSLAYGWAAGIGSGRVGIIPTTFKDETETDLFGEQAIIVGGMMTLMNASFETLVEAGYPKHLAYIECCHEVKQVADLIFENGFEKMLESVSNTAEYGAYNAINKLDTEQLRENLRKLLTEIQDGEFAQKFTEDSIPNQRDKLKNSLIEEVGKEIRSFMQQGTD